MNIVRAAGATLNTTPLDFNGNLQKIKTLIQEAKNNHVDIVCFPELCISGYGCEDVFFSNSTCERSIDSLLNLVSETQGLTVVLGLPLYFQGSLYNCAVTVQNQKILGFTPKKLLPREGVHYEPRWFKPWPFHFCDTVEIRGKSYPIGDHIFKFGNASVALEICEEAWGAVRSGSESNHDVDLILNPSASHFSIGKYQKRCQLVAERSRSTSSFYLYTNLVGLESGRLIYDGGVIFAKAGEIVATGKRFELGGGSLFFQDLNLDLVRLQKVRSTSTAANNEIIPHKKIIHANAFQDSHHGETSKSSNPAHTANEEFLFAEVLGLFDYLSKSQARGYVVSLSGGCDSATVATLVCQMFKIAWDHFGPHEIGNHLNIPPKNYTNIQELIQNCLSCIYQSTEQNSSVTQTAATKLAEQLGASFYDVNIDPLVSAYLKIGEECLGKVFKWQTDDITLQNIQARARAPMAWLLANDKGAILLSTSNRSEASVGYATMDGDTAGGLAPISGIDKPFLRKWLKWAETECEHGLGPIASLSLVNSQQPTAELRPKEASQIDEEDLMPYEILNAIEALFVRDRMSREDISFEIKKRFPHHEASELNSFIDKFFKLWCFNQWKRERLAPSFHIEDQSVDPKTWCRFPILSRPEHFQR